MLREALIALIKCFDCFCRQASNTTADTELPRLRLREAGCIGKRNIATWLMV